MQIMIDGVNPDSFSASREPDAAVKRVTEQFLRARKVGDEDRCKILGMAALAMLKARYRPLASDIGAYNMSIIDLWDAGARLKSSAMTYMWQYVTLPDPGGKGDVNVFELWMQDMATEAVRGPECRPDQSVPVFTNVRGETIANAFVPPIYAYDVALDGILLDADVTPFTDYMEALLPDPQDRDYVIRWLGWKLQHPDAQLPMILFHNPEKGTGRDTLFQFLKVLVGRHNCTDIRPSYFMSEGGGGDFRFTVWQEKLMAFMSEAGITGSDGSHAAITDRQIEQYATQLRSVLTIGDGLHGTVQGKGKDSRGGMLCCSIMAATNVARALALEPDDRRVAVFDNARVPPELIEALRYQTGAQDPVFLGSVSAYLQARAFESGRQAYAPPPMTKAKARTVAAFTETSHTGLVRAVLGDLTLLPSPIATVPQILAACEVWTEAEGHAPPTESQLRALRGAIAKLTHGRQDYLRAIGEDDLGGARAEDTWRVWHGPARPIIQTLNDSRSRRVATRVLPREGWDVVAAILEDRNRGRAKSDTTVGETRLTVARWLKNNDKAIKEYLAGEDPDVGKISR